MKVIKFRAWDKENKIWLDSSIFTVRFDGTGIQREMTKGLIGVVELMQYIGLKDKSGIDIFEGDIVKYTKRNPIKYLVSWDNKLSSFRLYAGGELSGGSKMKINSIQVIGNIYSNPELLK